MPRALSLLLPSVLNHFWVNYSIICRYFRELRCDMFSLCILFLIYSGKFYRDLIFELFGGPRIYRWVLPVSRVHTFTLICFAQRMRFTLRYTVSQWQVFVIPAFFHRWFCLFRFLLILVYSLFILVSDCPLFRKSLATEHNTTLILDHSFFVC